MSARIVGTGDKPAALDQYYKNLEIDPNPAPPRYGISVILVSIGRIPEARGMLRQLLEKHPSGSLSEPAGRLLQQIGPTG